MIVRSIRFFIFNKVPELSGDDDKAEVDHEEGADDDEHDKVDPVPERMSVLYKNCFGWTTFTVNFLSYRTSIQKRQWSEKSNLHKVHDVCPSLEGDNEEDGNPGQADVVKWDGPVERVRRARRALRVVLVPVHAPLRHLIRLMKRYDLINKK